MYMDPSFYATKEFESLTLNMGLKAGLVAIILTYIFVKICKVIVIQNIKKKYATEEIVYVNTFSFTAILIINSFVGFYIGFRILPFFIFSNLQSLELDFGFIETISRTALPWHIMLIAFTSIYLTYVFFSVIVLSNKKLIIFNKLKYLEFLPSDIRDIYVEEYSQWIGRYYTSSLQIYFTDKNNKKYCLGPYPELKEFYTTIKKTLKRRKIKNE